MKVDTYDSASRAKRYQFSSKNLIYQNQSPIENAQYIAYFFLYINIFANTDMKNTQFNLFYQCMLLLTKVKQFSNLLKIKKKLSYL